MANAKLGDRVRVHYTGMLEDGTIFDSSKGKDTLAFTIGEGRVIPGFESAVVDMEVGQRKKEMIPYDDAYGPHYEEMVQVVDRSMIPPDIDLEVGNHLQITREGGQSMVLTIVELTDDTVTLDGNHPLAGQDLVFEIELVEILEAAEPSA